MNAPEKKSILVTGGSRGIGAAIARALAADGWSVGVNYRNNRESAHAVVADIKAAGGSAIALGADIGNGDFNSLFDPLTDQFGPVLGLVNNAGVRADGLALQLQDQDWDAVLDTNLRAAFRLTRHALRGMLRARFGRVINVASVVGPRANAGQANYAAAKAGLIGFTKTVAAEVARKDITVNAVAPGLIATDMTTDLSPDFLKSIPANRAGKPGDVAAAVRYLASDDANYVTGTTLFVDGGLSA